MMSAIIDKLFKVREEDLIKEFLADLEEFELKRYSDMIRTLGKIRKKYNAKIQT